MSTKRPNGEGSLFFDEKKGLHRAMLVTPAGKRLTKSSKNEDVVKDWLNEQRLLIGRGQHVEPNTTTLSDWLYNWLVTYSKSNIRQRTYERYESLIDHVESIGHIPLQKITPNHLQTLYNTLQEEGYSAATRKKVHQLIHAALKRAAINRYIQTNPADLVDTPKVQQEEIEIFRKEDVDALLTTARPHKYYPLVLLAFTSGMRLGEILGLRWQDVDLNAGIVHVRQNLQASTKKGIIFEPPKTKTGKRKIPIPPQTMAALKEHKKAWSESRLQNPKKDISKKDPQTDDLIFVSEKHTPISPQNFLHRFWTRLQIDTEFAINNYQADPEKERKKLQTILSECRERPDWKQFDAKNFHTIRHTYATTLLANGVPIIDVSRALGHAKVSTTLDVYGHAIPEHSKLIAEKIAHSFLK